MTADQKLSSRKPSRRSHQRRRDNFPDSFPDMSSIATSSSDATRYKHQVPSEHPSKSIRIRLNQARKHPLQQA